MRNFARTLILSIVFLTALMIYQGFISPQVVAGRNSAQVDNAQPLKMLPLGTQDEFNRLKAVSNNQELAYAISQILGGSSSGNMPAIWSDGRNLDRGFALDGDSIEILDEVEDGWGTIEVPASLMNENYSNDAYVGNMAPASPYSGSYAGYEKEVGEEWQVEEEEAWEEEESDEAVLKLQGIIAGERGKLALINGEIWAEGDWLGEYKLSRIQDTRVVFQATDGSFFTVGM